jgi:hypothetical protein
MANEHPSLLRASSTDWDKAWDVINRLGTARQHLECDSDVVAIEPPVAREPEHEPAPVHTIEPRSLHRSLSVWILIGALWISIGMIVSAAIVTVAFLA